MEYQSKKCNISPFLKSSCLLLFVIYAPVAELSQDGNCYLAELILNLARQNDWLKQSPSVNAGETNIKTTGKK